MCGIFAVSGTNKQAGSFVLSGLKKLEYRGYDSWGVAVRSAGSVVIEKEVGKISDIDRPFVEGVEAFGHSRWATHGGVTKANAHPHRFGSVTLVHNGVCENFLELKSKFDISDFSSETDSEVIAAVVDKFFTELKDPRQALKKTAEVLHGRFALLVMFDGIDGIFAVRRGSPLIIGRSDEETYVASDIPAFLEQTNVVNYLDDNQGVHVVGVDVRFFDLDSLESIEKRNIEVSWRVEEAQKGVYDHFMLKEIFDQKETIARSINHDIAELEKAVRLLQSTNGAFLVACGTSHKVAMAAEYFFAEVAGKKVNVVPASEMKYFERFVHEKTAIIAISQSGETADIMEVIEGAKEKGAKLLSLTNVESSSLARLSDVNLPIQAGPEKAVASTKAATAQMAIMFLLAHGLAVKKPSADCFADNFTKHVNRGREILSSVASNISEMLNPRYEEHVKHVASKIFETKNLFIIGRGALYPVALEAAIKIQEVSYISAMGFAAGELKHGPIALIEKGTPCVVLGDDAETVSNAMELKARGAFVIGIAAENKPVFDEWIRVVDGGQAQAIASVIPVQILAYYLAVFKKLDPDMPRNLAKSVTVK